MIKLNDHSRVEKLARGHERLQGVPLHNPHRISELRKGGKSWKVIKSLIVQVLGTAIQIACNGATIKDGSFDKRGKGQIQREVNNWTLNTWGIRILRLRTR